MVGNGNERQQVYLYKRDYHLEKYGKPRFHICKCDTIEETIDKIIKYIKNGFKLEPDLQEFYSQFNFKTHNNTNEFIDYLIHLK